MGEESRGYDSDLETTLLFHLRVHHSSVQPQHMGMCDVVITNK